MFYNDQRVAMRRVVADFARSQVKLDYDMQTAIPTEFAVKPPDYPAFASIYRGAAPKSAPKSAPKPRPKEAPRHKPSLPAKRPTRIIQRRKLSGDTISLATSQKVSNKVWNTTITELPLSKTSSGRTPLRIVLYSRGNDGTRSLKMESHLMSAIGEKFEAYTAICCDFGRASMQQQISYAYHADMVSKLSPMRDL